MKHDDSHYRNKKPIRKQRRTTPSLVDSLDHTRYEMLVDSDYNAVVDTILDSNFPVVSPRFTSRDKHMRCSAMELLHILESGMRFTFVYESDYVRAHEELYAYLEGLYSHFGDDIHEVCDHVHLVIEYLEKTKSYRDKIVIRHPDAVTCLTNAAKDRIKRERLFTEVRQVIASLGLGSTRTGPSVLSNDDLDMRAESMQDSSVARDPVTGKFVSKQEENSGTSNIRRILNQLGA